MLVVVFYLLVPLMGFMAWSMNLSAHWMHSASEQIRLDALALSLCHSQQEFYKKAVWPLNLRIQTIQAEMAIHAAACAAGPFVCPSSLAHLRRLSIQGSKVMTIQDQLRKAQRGAQYLRLTGLTRANQLGSSFGILKAPLPHEDGLIRNESQSNQPDGYQGIKPPLTLKPGPLFDDLNHIKAKFHSKRGWIRMGQGFSSFNPQSQLIFRALESSCQIPWSGRVKRKFDGGEVDFSLK